MTPANPRARKPCPFFPGYLFVEAELHAVGISTFRYMPYCTDLVCSFGGEAAQIPNELIQGLRRRLSELAKEGGTPAEVFSKGERVAIVEGPFAGWEAVFDARLSW